MDEKPAHQGIAYDLGARMFRWFVEQKVDNEELETKHTTMVRIVRGDTVMSKVLVTLIPDAPVNTSYMQHAKDYALFAAFIGAGAGGAYAHSYLTKPEERTWAGTFSGAMQNAADFNAWFIRQTH